MNLLIVPTSARNFKCNTAFCSVGVIAHPPFCAVSERWVSAPTLQYSRKTYAKCRSAFTLLELIFAVALMSLLAAILFQAMRSVTQTALTSESIIAPGRDIENAMDLIRNDLQFALNPTANSVGYSTSSSTTTTPVDSTSSTTALSLAGSFIGAPTGSNGSLMASLIFYNTAAGPEHQYGDGEIKQVELAVINPANSIDRMLVRRVTSNLLTTTVIDPEDEIICRHVVGFTLRYYDGYSWLESWDSTQLNNELPAAVEVTIQLELKPDAYTGNQTSRSYARVFAIPCSTVIANSNASSSSSSTTSGTSSGSSKTGGK